MIHPKITAYITKIIQNTVSFKSFKIGHQWIVPQIFKLFPMRHIFFDLVIMFTTNRKYAFFCIF